MNYFDSSNYLKRNRNTKTVSKHLKSIKAHGNKIKIEEQNRKKFDSNNFFKKSLLKLLELLQLCINT